MKRKVVMSLAACGICAVGVVIGASAATLVHTVQAELRQDFTIVVDGDVKTFKNVQGEVVYPLLYEGTTYLPVRAIGELMGKTVYWYEDDKRIELKDEKTTVTDADVIVSGNSTSTDNKVNGSAPGGDAASTSTKKETALQPEDGEITLEQAKAIALEKAGLTEAEVRFTETKLEVEKGGVREYDIEFRVGRTEYSAEIRASDGVILSWEVDYD